MKKFIFGLIATVMLSFTGIAQNDYVKLTPELASKIKTPIKIYLGENSTVMTSENQAKVIKYLEDFNKGTSTKATNTQELKTKNEQLNSQYARDETYLLMQSMIKTTNSTAELLSAIESQLAANRIPKDKVDQFVLWHYSLQVADANQVFATSAAKAGPCWAGIVGSAGLGAIAGAGLGGIPTAGIGAAPGAIIGGICGALVGWSNC